METYLKVLDPDDSSAGGGAASAIAGAMAAALLSMVATLSRPGSGVDDTSDFAGIAERGASLSRLLREGAREDTESFQAVRDAYRLPKLTEGEKALRQRAIQEAWSLATRTPLENAGRCLAVLELGSELSGKVNPRVRSDYTTGLYLARAGVLGCLDNVAINLPSIKDRELAGILAARAEEFRSAGESVSARLGLPAMVASTAMPAAADRKTP